MVVICKLVYGGCCCGQCPIGAKSMSVKDKLAYNRFAKNLTYEETGSEYDPSPYWRTIYPWIVDRENLPDNLSAVLGVMNATKRKFKKDPRWEKVYESQLRDLIYIRSF